VSDENVELARRGIAAINRINEGGLEALGELIDSDFELTTPASLATEPGTYIGLEGLRRYFDSFYEAMDRVSLEIREIHDYGDRVLTELTLRARGRSTGIEAEQAAVMLWRMRDGRVTRCEVFPELEQALAAVEAGPG
jgi:ketosteroid isomerase-like protein